MKYLALDAVLEVTKGHEGLRRALYRTGQPVPSRQNIQSWQRTAWIPSHWVGAVLYALTCLPKFKLEQILKDCDVPDDQQ